MIRKLLLPVLLTGLLGGCVTAGYGYRDGYYYGQPSVEYRYHDYGYPYGYYPGYGSGYYPYGYYGYGYPYYYGGYPYYYRHHYRRPKPVPGTTPPPNDPGDNHDRPPPWRDLDRRRMNDLTRRGPTGPVPQAVAPRGENRGQGPRTQPLPQRTQEPRRRQSGETNEP